MSQEPPPSPDAILRDWMTLWKSEAAAMAVDREMQESWARAVQDWMSQFAPDAGHESNRDTQPATAGADAAARAAAAAAASDAEPRLDAELASLRDEISQLRRRIEQLESAAARPARAAGRKPAGGG